MKRSARGIVTVFLALALLLTACLPAAGLASGTGGSRTVKAGFFAYPGYHEISDGTLSGYGFDFLTCLQRHTRLNFEFEGYENSWEEMQEMLLDGRIDLVTSARKTAEREEKFDFSEPIGTNSARISVRADDSRFIPGDYESMRGITIGILAGNSRNDDLAAFALEKGFGYIPVAFSTAEELSAALADGTVDAICTSSLRKAAGEKTVAEFAPEEFYVIVRKGDTALLDEVNYGINQMDVCEGNWRSDLYYENYTAAGTPSLSFTRREQEYIAAVQSGQTVITVTAQLDKMPYSFEEDGRLTGIIPDYFAHLMDMAGLPYTVLMPRAGADYADWVAENGVTVIMDGRRGDSPNAQYEYGLSTDSYITLTISRVTRRGFDGTISTVAAAGTMKTVYVDSDIAEKVEYISMSDPQDALRAVSRGEADACYVYTSMADRYINADPDGDLQAVILTDPVYDVYICIDPASGHELCSILNKCIRADIPGTLDGITARYTTVTYRNMDLSRYLYLHPAVLITAIAVLVVLIVSIAVAAFRARIAEMKNTQLKHDMEQQRKLEESLTFTDFFLDTYVSAYYVNMNDMSCQIYKRTDELEKNYPVVGDYFTSLQEYIARDVHPDDREKLLAVTEPGKMREILTRQSEYTHTFRDISGGKESIYRLQVIRGADAGHAAIGFIDITGELQEQQVRLLGAVPVSRDILSKASIGLWAFELDEGRAPRMYADEAMLPLLGLDHPVSPEETYHVWYDHIDAGAYGLVEAAVEKMSAGVHAEVQYPWHYPDGRT
ncbi:MAG: hypothetical protein CW338_08920, partial [Clostridiales bacterium]|nr:hypothetical protein [Clostridiales bacterium]